MVKILVVGAGVTGSLCAYLIRQRLPSKLQCQIIVWEKSRGIGGRMAASRNPSNMDSIAELGAQYITPQKQYKPLHFDFYQELDGILSPITQDIAGLINKQDQENLKSKTGLSAIAKHFFNKSFADIMCSQRLTELKLNDNNPSNWHAWEAFNENGNSDNFDAVILTMPVPQILEINQSNSFLNTSQSNLLSTAKYSSRYALGLFYSEKIEVPNYCARYVNSTDNKTIRYVSFDNIKREDNESVTSIVVHTSKEFGDENIDKHNDDVQKIVYGEFKKLYPNFPEPSYTKCHKWRYSQVTETVKECNGCMAINQKPLLVLAGDGFTHSNLGGCIESAKSATECFINWYNKVN